MIHMAIFNVTWYMQVNHACSLILYSNEIMYSPLDRPLVTKKILPTSHNMGSIICESADVFQDVEALKEAL